MKKREQDKLVEALRRDGRSGTADIIAAMSPEMFANRAYRLLYRCAADIVNG